MLNKEYALRDKWRYFSWAAGATPPRPRWCGGAPLNHSEATAMVHSCSRLWTVPDLGNFATHHLLRGLKYTHTNYICILPLLVSRMVKLKQACCFQRYMLGKYSIIGYRRGSFNWYWKVPRIIPYFFINRLVHCYFHGRGFQEVAQSS